MGRGSYGDGHLRERRCAERAGSQSSHRAKRGKWRPSMGSGVGGWVSKCIEQVLAGPEPWGLSVWSAHIHFLAGRLEANRQLIRKITEELNIMEEVGSGSQADECGSPSFMGEQRPTCLPLKGQLPRALSDQEGKGVFSKGLLWNTHSSGPWESNQDLETCVATTYIHDA